MRYSDLAEKTLPGQFEFSQRHSRAAASASVTVMHSTRASV